MTRRIEPFEWIVLGVGIAAFLGVSVTQLNAAAPDLLSTYSGIIGGVVGAGGTIFAGWLAFVAGRRQTQSTLDQQILLHNRQIAQALRETAAAIDHETAVASGICNAMRQWVEGPVVDPNDIVTADELPNVIAIPSAAWSAHSAITMHCRTVTTISRAIRGRFEHAHRMAKKFYAGEFDSRQVPPAIARSYREVDIDCAELKVISSFLQLNAEAIADSRQIEISLRRLPWSDVEECAKFYNVRTEDMEFALLEPSPELAIIEPQPHRSPPTEKSG